MISTLLGKKLGMTQVYDAQNVLVPVTVVEAGPCPVVQVKTTENDGYNAVQLGFSKKKSKNTSSAEQAHAKNGECPFKRHNIHWEGVRWRGRHEAC